MSDKYDPNASAFAALRQFTAGAAAAEELLLADGRMLRVVPMADIRPDPHQVRALDSLVAIQAAAEGGNPWAAQELAELQALSASIQEIGLQQPLGVVEDGRVYRLIFGHRRYLALQMAQAREVPCVVWSSVPTSLHLRLQIEENWRRKDLGDAEVHEALVRYKQALAQERGVAEEEVSWAEVSANFGIPDDTRKRLARLKRLDPVAYALARETRLSEYVLRPLLQYNQQVEEGKGEPLAAEAQRRVVQGVAEADTISPSVTATLLRAELGGEEPVPPPTGRSDLGVKLERRWAGMGQEVQKLRKHLGDLTTDDRAALQQSTTALRTMLDQVQAELSAELTL